MSPTFSHVFPLHPEYELDKEASIGDVLRVGGYGLRSSLAGSHGVKGVLPVLKTPVKSMWEGFKAMDPGEGASIGNRILGKGFQAMNLGFLLGEVTRDGGPAERAGRVAGNVLPMALMSPKLGPKAPGLLGNMLIQDTLGGGMFVERGLLERAGTKVDDFLGFSKKKAPKPTPIKTTSKQLDVPGTQVSSSNPMPKPTMYLKNLSPKLVNRER